MKSVILFGGGDAGGLIITKHGVRPIPPFAPEVRFALKAAASMVNAVSATQSESTGKKIAKVATSLCNLSVELVEQVVGPLDENRAIVYQDEDGGFTCGSTGKPPIPIPWPPQLAPSVPDLIAAGVIEPDLVAFLDQARNAKVKIIEVFEKPQSVAKKLNISLSEKSASDLNLLAPSKLNNVKDETEREIIGFFQKVAEDGRYLETWFAQPYEVSETLKVKLSDRALEQIATGGAATAFSLGGTVNVSTAIKAGVVWAIVCIAVGIIFGEQQLPIDQIVKDRSGAEKI